MFKTFLIFSGRDYYPQGGWEDYRGTCSLLSEAQAILAERSDDWGHVVNAATGEIAAASSSDKALNRPFKFELVAKEETEQRDYEAYFDACERANTVPLCFDAWLAADKPETPRG